MSQPSFRVEYDKHEGRWGVYGEDWICDCIDKQTAMFIARLLNEKQVTEPPK